MNIHTSVAGGSSAYTKRSHTRHKAPDFIQSCKMSSNVDNPDSRQGAEISDGFKKRRRRRRRNKNKHNVLLDNNSNCQNLISEDICVDVKCKEVVQLGDEIKHDVNSKEALENIMQAENIKQIDCTPLSNAGSFDPKEVVCLNKVDQTIEDSQKKVVFLSKEETISHISNDETQAVIFNADKIFHLKSIENAVEVIAKDNDHDIDKYQSSDVTNGNVRRSDNKLNKEIESLGGHSKDRSLRISNESHQTVNDGLVPKINEKSIIKYKLCEDFIGIEKFGKEYSDINEKNAIIDATPSFGTNDVVFENTAKNRLSNKCITNDNNNVIDNNIPISCFSSRNDAVLKSYGDRFYGAREIKMSSECLVKESVVISKDKFECDASNSAREKTPQFWPGQKRRSKRNKSGNSFVKKVSPKIKSEKSNSEVSWLDFADADDCDVNVKDENYRFDDKSSECDVNEQLSSYKNRFLSSHVVDDKIDADIDWNNKRLECKSDVSSNRIGVNVNNLNSTRSGKWHDGTKRSRRKPEPFDFDKQSECNVKDLLQNCKLKGFYDPSEHRHRALDIPNSICSFLTDTLDTKPAENVSRSLFSGSISDKGLYIPSTDANDRGILSLKRNSFQKIFETDDSFDISDSGSDSDSASDDDELFDSAEDDTDERGEGVLLPPEPQLGNVEYKLKLVNPTKQRFEHLVTQMKWRLREGRGEAVYGIGVRDCGRVRGLRSGRMKASLRTLRRMSDRLGAQCSLLAVVRTGGTGRYGAEVLVRKVPDDQHNMELRVAVMGANDAGKSTLVGVLTQGELDNGRGSARLNMFRHLHEVRTGRTSSVSHEILGFDSQGRPINYAYGDLTTPEEIVERSSKLVSFIDLAGHRKYLKTTVQGLTGYSPHLAMLVISATGGVNQMTLEHLALAVALQLPLFVVSTRADCAPVPEEAIADMLTRANSRKVPHIVRTLDDCTVAAVSVWGLRTVPVFSVSSVSGQGLDLLRWFLYRLPPPPQCNNTAGDMDQEAVEFQIDEVFRVGDRGGPVVAGLLKTGVITEKTKLLIGPLDSGGFAPAIVESMRRNRAACRAVRAGQAASLRLDCTVPHLRQGMVLLSIPEKYPYSLDISDYEDKYTAQIKTNDTKVCKEKILSESSHLWNSEKVSPKATKKMRRRRKKLITNDNKNANDEKYADSNLNIIKEDSSTDDRDTYDELEHNCDDGNLSGTERHAKNKRNEITNNLSNTDRLVVNFDKRVVDYEKSTVDYDKGVVDRIQDKNVYDCAVVGDADVDDIIVKDAGHRNSLSILNLPLDKDLESLVKCFPVDDSEGNVVSRVMEEGCSEPRGCFFFQAQVKLLHNSSDIYPGFQSTVHIGSIRQTAVVEAILSPDSGEAACVRPGSQACLLFRFLRHPEYLRVSSPLLFREGLHTKGVGHVTHIYHHRNNTTSVTH